VNLFTIFNAVLVAVWNRQRRGRTDFSSPISCISDRRTAFSKFWFFQLSSANWR